MHNINFVYQSVEVIEELDSKQRNVYGLEIMENGKDYEILSTNLQPFFWRKVKNIIRQNQKAALQQFLFGSNQSIEAGYQALEELIQNMSARKSQ